MVSARRLVKVFGGTVALKGVDFEARAGEVVAIEGANGSGKSTLLGVLGGLQRATSGAVSYGATDVRIGWVSHDGWCYAELSGRANLSVVASLNGLKAAAVDEACERFEIGAFGARAIKTYSRGQKQRVALAMAVMGRPELLLLDEPTTGLDRRGVERLVEVVREERGRGAAVLVVAHDSVVTSGAATRRVMLERGRVVAEAWRGDGRWANVSRETLGLTDPTDGLAHPTDVRIG